MALLVVVVVAVAAAVAVFVRDRRTPECGTADSLVDYIHAHPDMLDSTLITHGDPDLGKYQQWSAQLHAYGAELGAWTLSPGAESLPVWFVASETASVTRHQEEQHACRSKGYLARHAAR